MLLEAIYHRPKQNWSYAYDEKIIHLRIRTKRNDVDQLFVLFGDKFSPWTEMKKKPMERFTHDALFDYWQVELQPAFRRLAYGFKLQEGNETVWMTESGFKEEPPTEHFGLFEYPFLNPIDILKPPAWVKDAVFYQIFPERFANGNRKNDPKKVEAWGDKPTTNNFFGGDLQGVIDHLDYLEKLGINAIYFTPVFEATTNHKYDTQDYMKIDPHFGDNETLKRLIEQCHQRGIRVLLDAVFNHAGSTFPPFVDVMKNGKDSVYADWFHVRQWPLQVIDEVPTYDTFSFVESMPKLNTENPDAQKYLLEVARYWVEEIGIDGWRLDVANEVDHAFWRKFHSVVKNANPDAYILGEIWHDSMMWLQGDQFDAVMNYPFTNAVLDFFTKEKIDGKEFANLIGSQIANYPLQAHEVAFNLLDSHDTARLLTLCDEDKRKMKAAALFQFTFFGTPCIYYGDEIGMNGETDPDCRKCMVWDESEQDLDLFSFYQRIIQLRRTYPALRTGTFQFIHAKKEDTRLIYERKDQQDHFVIMMNVNSKSQHINVNLKKGDWMDMMSNQAFHSSGEKMKLTLPAYGFYLLKSKD